LACFFTQRREALQQIALGIRGIVGASRSQHRCRGAKRRTMLNTLNRRISA
jgi:hypothetical protein